MYNDRSDKNIAICSFIKCLAHFDEDVHIC